MLKRGLLLLSVFVLIIMCFTACGAGDVGSKEYMASKQAASAAQVAAESSKPEVEPQWGDTFEDLINCFDWNGYIDVSTKFETAANVIGANEGYRFTSNAGGKSFYIELYYYDPQNPLAQKEESIDSISQNGCITLLEKNVPGVVSDNGKYVMLYSNTSTDENDVTAREEIYSKLKSFK